MEYIDIGYELFIKNKFVWPYVRLLDRTFDFKLDIYQVYTVWVQNEPYVGNRLM